MAIYHMSVKIGSRAKGQNALASAAYRSATKLHSQAEERDFCYTRKQSVVHSEIVLPQDAPAEYQDRQVLWNAVENQELQKNAQLYREFEISLPNESSDSDKLSMAREFAQSLAKEGMCVDFSIHDVKAGQYRNHGRATNDNCHVHMMCTMRSLDSKGLFLSKRKRGYKLDSEGQKIPVLDEKKIKAWETKNKRLFNYKTEAPEELAKVQKTEKKSGRKLFEREDIKLNNWDSKDQIEIWRERWEQIANQYLPPEKHIDHRSLEAQIEAMTAKLNKLEEEISVAPGAGEDRLFQGFMLAYERQMKFSPPKDADGLTLKMLKREGYGYEEQLAIGMAFNSFLKAVKAQAKAEDMLICDYVEERLRIDYRAIQGYLEEGFKALNINPDKHFKQKKPNQNFLGR